jgi:hypothetical protein
MAVLILAVTLGSVAAALLGFALYLAFCAFIVIRTGGTSGLRDVAVAIRAFASVANMNSRSSLRRTAQEEAEPLQAKASNQPQSEPTLKTEPCPDDYISE